MKDQQQDAGLPEYVEGGYHRRGVPGEEATARRQMRVLKVRDRSERIVKSRPLKGAAGGQESAFDRSKPTAPTL